MQSVAPPSLLQNLVPGNTGILWISFKYAIQHTEPTGNGDDQCCIATLRPPFMLLIFDFVLIVTFILCSRRIFPNFLSISRHIFSMLSGPNYTKFRKDI